MPWSFLLSIRADERLVETVQAVAAAAARRAAFVADAAETMGRTVAAAAALIVGAAGGEDLVDIAFSVVDGRFETRLSYAGDATRLPIEGDGMDVAFSRDGRRSVCTMARTLPTP